jgi:hypothetical protein
VDSEEAEVGASVASEAAAVSVVVAEDRVGSGCHSEPTGKEFSSSRPSG